MTTSSGNHNGDNGNGTPEASPCEKYEEWPAGYIALVLLSILVWLIAGVWICARYGAGHAAIFGILFIVSTIITPYAFCRRCYYYGKKCYTLMGLAVPC